MRHKDIDILKAIALCTIVLAHVEAPVWLQQIRNFSVPLMVLIAGHLHSLKHEKKAISYREYITKRLTRLLKPTWYFLALFFAASGVFFILLNQPFPFDPVVILHSFLLSHFDQAITGIWIIRVFVLLAIVAPLLVLLLRKIRNLQVFLATLFGCMLLSELAVIYYQETGIALIDYVIQSYLFYLIPYGFIYALGMSLLRINRLHITWLTGVFALLFLFGMFFIEAPSLVGEVPLTQDYKYPPRLYYISYAMMWSLGLYLLIHGKSLGRGFLQKFATFISKFSLAIYFWHIAFLYLWEWTSLYIVSLPKHWALHYLAVLLLPIFAVYFSLILRR